MLKLLSTVVSRSVTLLLSFAIVVLNSRFLGASGVGTISLVVLTISVMVIANEIVGGGALVYLSARYNISNLLIIAYCWSVINATIFYFILPFLHLLPAVYLQKAVVLGLLFSLISINNNLLLGKQKIIWYNVIVIIQFALIFVVTWYLFNVQVLICISSYITALTIAYIIIFVSTLVLVLTQLNTHQTSTIKDCIKTMFKMGFWAQIANLTQLVNYRFNYYTLEHYSSTAELGKFSVATQISEGAWVLGRSNALIKYAEVSNTKDIEIAYKVIWNAKLVGLLTFGIMVIINLIPDKLFQIIFGVEFQAMQYIFLLISPGIIMLSVTMTISSFFSGIGRIYLNSTGSVIGLLITIPLSLWLVKLYGAMGAAIVCSVSYGAITLYSIVVFFSITKIPVRTILISKADFLPIYNWLKRIK